MVSLPNIIFVPSERRQDRVAREPSNPRRPPRFFLFGLIDLGQLMLAQTASRPAEPHSAGCMDKNPSKRCPGYRRCTPRHPGPALSKRLRRLLWDLSSHDQFCDSRSVCARRYWPYHKRCQIGSRTNSEYKRSRFSHVERMNHLGLRVVAAETTDVERPRR